MAQSTPEVTLGPYKITEQIGMGGMATVYKAYHANMDRYVAIKILPDQHARDEQFVARFSREARTIAKLEHKNILPVYDYGEQKGTVYLVMRYLDGGTLGELMAQGSMSLNNAVEIITQICSALDYAHRQGIIHRDIKPANIMVDSEGAAYLTDFGIAKVLEATESLTQTGMAVGTPDYMAPEQGLGQTVDARTDIYAMGVILYQLAVGRTPYQASTPMAIALAHIHEQLPMPSQVNPNVPEEIEEVILKALEKDPDDRYQSAGELAGALKNAIQAADTLEVVSADQIDLPSLIVKAQANRPQTSPNQIAKLAESGAFPWNTAPVPSTIESPKRTFTVSTAMISVVGVFMLIIIILLGSLVFSELSDSSGEEEAPVPPPTALLQNPPPQGGSQDSAPPPGPSTYDDFSNAEFDGGFNESIWDLDDSGCEVFQENGQLNIVNESGSADGSVCDLILAQPSSLILGQHLESFDVTMQLRDNFDGEWLTSVVQVENFGGSSTWGARCGIRAAPEPVIVFDVYNVDQAGNENIEYTAEEPVELETWYKVSLYIAPRTFEATCLIDDAQLGAYTPADTANFANQQFSRGIMTEWDAYTTGAISIDQVITIIGGLP